MKIFFLSLMLLVSLQTWSQSTVTMDKETILINDTQTRLVRTSKTPEKVTVYFNIPMTRLYCEGYEDIDGPRGRGNRCIPDIKKTKYELDKVTLTFKKISKLKEDEAEYFLLSGTQRRLDSENVIYSLKALETISSYQIKKTGLVGIDSFLIEKMQEKEL